MASQIQSEISLLDLCAEIQEIIFSYLNGQDIKNLLLTCTNLNENLSTSSNLMKKLSLIINEQETDVFSIRKYSKIQFYESSEEKMVQVLSIYGNHIRSISINSSLEISVTTIAKITNLCPNLQKIKLNNFHRYLKADVNYTLLKVSKTTTSATFTDYDWKLLTFSFDRIINVEIRDWSQILQFPLKAAWNIQLLHVLCNFSQLTDYFTFLASHKETMQELTFVSTHFNEILFVMRELKNLRKLDITVRHELPAYTESFFESPLNEENTNLNDLTIAIAKRLVLHDIDFISHILLHYSSLQELSMDILETEEAAITSENLLRKINLPLLKTFRVFSCDSCFLNQIRCDNLNTVHITIFKLSNHGINNSFMTSVRKLFVTDARVDISKIALFYPQLEYFKVRSSEKVSTKTIRELKKYAKQLKVLEINSQAWPYAKVPKVISYIDVKLM